jgi:hypothetical protein
MSNHIIDIGTKINLSELLATRLLIQANSGGGKSTIARAIMEKSHGLVPFIILDIEGEHYTLKEKFGDILVIGGQYGDLGISMKSAKLLPREIISNRLNVVIDLSSLKMDDRILYAKYFLEAMMELPKEYWVNYLVFIEEAHRLCGQQDKYVSGPAVKDLMSRGRKRGYCGVLITQRISKLHKDAAAECNNKFIGRTFLDLDLNRAAEELALSNKNDRLLLRDLKPGHFYAFGIAIDPVHVHEVTIEMPKTKIPKAGANLDIKPQAPTDKLKSMLAKLNDLPAEAEKELKTMRDLQAEVTRLKTELVRAAKQSSAPVAVPASSKGNEIQKSKIDELQKNVVHLQQLLKKEGLINKDLHRAISVYEKRMVDMTVPLTKIIERLGDSHGIKIGESGTIVQETGTNVRKNDTIVRYPETNVRKVETRAPIAGDGAIGKCSREVIKFLSQFSDRSFTKAQVAIATGYSAGSGGFNNALSELNTRQFIIRESGKLQVNSDAISEIILAAGEIVPQEYSVNTFKKNLKKCEAEVYQVLLDHPEKEFSKDELADSTETKYSSGSGGFNNALSRLSTLELMQRTNGRMRLNPELLELMS